MLCNSFAGNEYICWYLLQYIFGAIVFCTTLVSGPPMLADMHGPDGGELVSGDVAGDLSAEKVVPQTT